MSISIYEQKADYVKQLQTVLGVSDRFDRIDYTRDFLRGDEYIRIKNTVGDTFYINVTGNSESAILMEVARFVNGVRPTGYITNEDTRWRVAQLFRKAVS